MRIAVIAEQFPVRSETFVHSQVIGLLRLGHDVRVFANPPQNRSSGMLSAEGLQDRIHYFPWCPQAAWKRAVKALWQVLRLAIKRPSGALRALTHLPKALQAETGSAYFDACTFWQHEPCDAILCHFGQVGMRMAQPGRLGLLPGKLAVIFHGADISKFIVEHGPQVYRELFEVGHLFLPVSERWAQVLRRYGCPADKVEVLHMGIDCGRFEFRERRRAPGEATKLLSVCRFVEKKGLEYAIRAFALAAARVVDPIVYTIVGDGSLRPHLQQLIAELNLDDAVQLVGWKQPDEVLQLLYESHLFIAPSVTAADGDQEGIPVAIMEAMALGLPVVSTQHSGIPELVIDGITGYLAPERDVTMLADQMHSLMAHPELWPSFGKRSREKIMSEFNQQKLDLDLERRLQDLVYPGSAAACAVRA